MSDIYSNGHSFLSSPPSLKRNIYVSSTLRGMLSEQSPSSPVALEAALLLKCQGCCCSRLQHHTSSLTHPCSLIPVPLDCVSRRCFSDAQTIHRRCSCLWKEKDFDLYSFFLKYYLEENVWQLKFPPSKRYMQKCRSKVPPSTSKPFFGENPFPSLAIKKLILHWAKSTIFPLMPQRSNMTMSAFCSDFKEGSKM